MATKYKQYFQRMLETEKDLFYNFEILHKKYSGNQESMQNEFNKKGAEVVKVIHQWEAKLCSQSEKAGFATFTTKLSEKFMEEVRKKYPLIDFVGVISKKEPKLPKFNIKKISLNT